jgi:hypothetical protein
MATKKYTSKTKGSNNKSNAGRKDVWTTTIEPNLENIKKWYKDGALESDIIKKLGVSSSSYYKYKAEKTELSEIANSTREIQCEQIQNALYKKALGYFETDTKTYWRKPRGADDNQAEFIYKEDNKKYYPPDVSAGLVLLKHWDKKNEWTNDPQLYELKKQANEVEAITKLKEKWINLDDIEDGKKLLKELRGENE